MATDIGEVVIREFPYPIAYSYWQMERVKRETFQRQLSHLLDTFEITVRFLSTVVLNNYAKDGAFDAEWNTRLNEMFDKPLTLGAWVVFLQETTRRYASREADFFVPELYRFYFKQKGAKVKLESTAKELGAFVAERNKAVHSLTWTEEQYRESFESNREAFDDILEEMRFISNYELIIPLDIDNGIIESAYICTGHSSDFNEEFLHLSIEVDDVQKEHPMLICKDNPKQQLLIYPLFYFYDDPMNRRMELYLYDGLERKKGNVKRLDFLNVRDGKKFPVTETVDNVDLRELFNDFRKMLEILNHESTKHPAAEVFISYASCDCERVMEIVSQLESAGISVWVDRHKIEDGVNYGPEIVRSIRDCKILMLMCTDASMRSNSVKQEIQLAWKYEQPYLPLLLEPINFPEQVEYWLEGWQWIEVMDLPPEHWLPSVLQVLRYAGVQCHKVDQANAKTKLQFTPMQSEYSLASDAVAQPIRPEYGWKGLLSVAKFTDQIWPLPAGHVQRGITAKRDLGAPQDDVQHGYRLGSRVCLAIESDREGYLLLLDQGTSGKIYCLCPSWFAPDTRLPPGRSYLPQVSSRYDAFAVTGQPGREHLVAIITDEPLRLDLMPTDPKTPAHVLTQADIDTLLAMLRDLEGNRWTALSTYFDVVSEQKIYSLFGSAKTVFSRPLKKAIRIFKSRKTV